MCPAERWQELATQSRNVRPRLFLAAGPSQLSSELGRNRCFHWCHGPIPRDRHTCLSARLLLAHPKQLTVSSSLAGNQNQRATEDNCFFRLLLLQEAGEDLRQGGSVFASLMYKNSKGRILVGRAEAGQNLKYRAGFCGFSSQVMNFCGLLTPREFANSPPCGTSRRALVPCLIFFLGFYPSFPLGLQSRSTIPAPFLKTYSCCKTQLKCHLLHAASPGILCPRQGLECPGFVVTTPCIGPEAHPRGL